MALPFSGEGTAGLDVPLMVFDRGKLKTLGNLSNGHTTLHILLVGENQQTSFFQILMKRKEELKSSSVIKKQKRKPDSLRIIPSSNMCVRTLMQYQFS